jgi:4-carboxymuconolactone decarboxylase
MSTDERWERGAEMFETVTGFAAPPKGADYVADVVVDQIFSEIWTRPGLTIKERRWIAITCACWSGAPVAMDLHLSSALRTGDITVEELREFVVQFAVYAGHPKGTAARSALDAAWAKVQAEQAEQAESPG